MHPRFIGILVAAAALVGVAGGAHGAEPLPRLANVDTTRATVSGLSAGAFMANQLGWAYSSYFKGVGMFAGGPYRCGGHNMLSFCMQDHDISAAQLAAMQADIEAASGATMDASANVAGQRVFLFVGSKDRMVGRKPMDAVHQQYLMNGVNPDHIKFEVQVPAGHVFPTVLGPAGAGVCSNGRSPAIRNCGYDGAGEMLQWLYGPLNRPNDTPDEANYLEFDQTAFTANAGLAATGWAYLPADCRQGGRCKVHVALHGCEQTQERIGARFVKETGYARWADSNAIVVLFPQAQRDDAWRSTPASGLVGNSFGCFDWVGWYGRDFAQKGASQLAAIKAMVDHLSSAAGSAPPAGCHTATNAQHTAAGRARAWWFFAYANGSGENMGVWNHEVRTTLRRTAPNHYVIGGC